MTNYFRLESEDSFKASLSLLSSSENSFVDKASKFYEKIILSSDNQSLLLSGLSVINSYDEFLQAYVRDLASGPKILFPRLSNSKLRLYKNPSACIDESLNSHRGIIISCLDSIPSEEYQEKNIPFSRTLVLLGAASLALLNSQSLPDYIQKVLVIETDPAQLAVGCMLCNLGDLVQELRSINVGLQFLLEPDFDTLKQRFRQQVVCLQPICLNGLSLIRSPLENATLQLFESWLRSPEGLTQDVVNRFGSETDELNQLFQSIVLAATVSRRTLLTPQHNLASQPVVLIGSGPSLDNAIPWLQKHQNRLQIVAAGSSLGVLLRNKISPSAVVFLERSSTVMDTDLQELVEAGIKFSQIPLIASMTLDPRIYQLFKNVAWFHRPLSAVCAFFYEEIGSSLLQAGPHSLNAALEALLFLGYRNVLLIGCDFGADTNSYPRAQMALGNSPRSLDLPVRGRHGKTVYSSPELYSASLYFANALIAYGASVSSAPSGVALSGVTPDLVNLDDVAAETFKNSHSFIADWSDMPVSASSVDDLLARLKMAANASSSLFQQLVDLVTSVEQWNLSLMRALDLALKLDETEMQPVDILVKRLCFYSVFMALQPLHDSLPSEWSHNKKIVLANLQWLDAVYAEYFRFICEYLPRTQDLDFQFSWQETSVTG